MPDSKKTKSSGQNAMRRKHARHILVTGGAGFIGSHLCEALIARGCRVTALDDLSTGSRRNLTGLAGEKRFQLHIGSVLDNALVRKCVARADYVFHLASAVGVRLIIEKPVETIATIARGTETVLAAARAGRVPLLLTSSSEVYGKAAKVPFAECDDVVLGPTSRRRWLYACAKMLDEFLALAHWQQGHLPVVCVRLFNTVGPRQTGRYGMVLPRFVAQALKGEPITVFGNGRQTRSFCHVADVVDGLLALMHCPAAAGKVVNLGCDKEISINALARRVAKLVGSKSQLQHVPYEQAYIEGFEDMSRRVPDLTLARRLTGFSPHRSLDDAILDLATWKTGDK